MHFNTKDCNGFLLFKIRIMQNAPKRKKGRKQGKSVSLSKKAPTEENLSKEEEEELVDLFQNCVLTRPDNKKKLKEALAKSLRFRDRLMSEHIADISEYFGFYFVSPDLV